jgi:hypothetical protein
MDIFAFVTATTVGAGGAHEGCVCGEGMHTSGPDPGVKQLQWAICPTCIHHGRFRIGAHRVADERGVLHI